MLNDGSKFAGDASRISSAITAPPHSRCSTHLAQGLADPEQRRGPSGRALLLGLVTLTLLALLLVQQPPPAQADPEALWSATLTVDVSAPYEGCDDYDSSQDDCSTALTDTTFTYEGTDYTITQFFVDTSTREMIMEFSVFPPSAFQQGYTLSVGDTMFDLKDGTWVNNGVDIRVVFSGVVLDWIDDENVLMSIAEMPEALWSATLTVDVSAPFEGCDDRDPGQDNCSTALTDTTFTYEDTDYTITVFYVDTSSEVMLTVFDVSPPSAFQEGYTLSVGDTTFNLKDGTWSSDEVEFSGVTLDWIDGQTVILRLQRAPLPGSPIDREILETFYEATGGPSWLLNDNWKTSADISSWYGVVTNNDGRVTALDLWSNHLTGEIPHGLGGLTELTRIYLNDNRLTGEIPDDLGDLAHLTELRLDENLLEGEIPPELGGLTDLADLFLNDNRLTGEIPSELGNLAELAKLYLDENLLEGEIPSELGNLAELEYLFLSDNLLEGEIPSELGNLAELGVMRLSDNLLTGKIPPELGDLAKLYHLFLDNNDLTGEIPSELGNIANLLRLQLQNNDLTGEIPSELGDITTMFSLILTNNRLTGEIPPELGNFTTLEFLYLDNNRLTGEIPPELGSLAEVTRLLLSGNELTGEIPPELGDLSNLVILYLNGNDLTGAIPPALGGLTDLSHLVLHGNQLTGGIPPELGGLFYLDTLMLHDNQLTGGLPDLTGLTELINLGLGGNDLELDWSMFEASGRLNLESPTYSFEQLFLHESGLKGPIPDWIGEQHTDLLVLWLQDNRLTGTIPSNFSNLVLLYDLRLAGNLLEGQLPSGLPDETNVGLVASEFATQGRSVMIGGRSYFLKIDVPQGADEEMSSVSLSPSSVKLHLPPHPRIARVVNVVTQVDVEVEFRDADGEPVEGSTTSPAVVCVPVPESTTLNDDQELVLLHESGEGAWRVLPLVDHPAGYAPGDGYVALCGATDRFSVFAAAIVDLVSSGPGSISRISRIEPSIRSVTVSAGDKVQLSFDIYGRQDIHDNDLGDGHVFAWDDGVAAGTFKASDRANIIIYTAPSNPGTHTVTATSPSGACLAGEDFDERCSAKFTIIVRRSSADPEERPAPKNPVGVIPSVLVDAEGRQYEVFTPEEGGTFEGDGVTISADAGVVPNGELIGLRMSQAGPASNEGVTYGRYTPGGDWYAIDAVDASGRRVEGPYGLNSHLDVCLPLPLELRSNISDLAMVAMNTDDSLTILSSRVRLSTYGTKVCGHLSTVPAIVAVGTAGVPRPLPTVFPEAPDDTGTPDAGGVRPPSQTVMLWTALIGLSISVVILAFLLVRRRKTGPTQSR